MAQDATNVAACLQMMDVDSKVEQNLLYQQRVICGWKMEVVPEMFEQMRQQQRTMYWICVPSTSSVDVSEKNGMMISATSTAEVGQSVFSDDGVVHIPLLERSRTTPTTMTGKENRAGGFLPVGHISIDFLDFGVKSTPLLGTSDGRIVSISTLFVLPPYRKLGLAKWAMGECERRIRSGSHMHDIGGEERKVKCEIISLSSMSGRHYMMPGPEGMGMWDRVGKQPGRYLGDWYGSLGYERIHEMEKFRDKDTEGREVFWWCEVWHKRV